MEGWVKVQWLYSRSWSRWQCVKKCCFVEQVVSGSNNQVFADGVVTLHIRFETKGFDWSRN